jgi:putative ABC transport system ATP-binding protein
MLLIAVLLFLPLLVIAVVTCPAFPLLRAFCARCCRRAVHLFTLPRRGAAPARGDDEAEQIPPPVFAVRGLQKSYAGPAGSVPVLRGADFDVGDGLTALLGSSGSGKTTTLNILGGLDTPDGGRVEYRGVPVPYGNERGMRWYRSRAVAWVFQELNLISHQTALENAALPLLCQGCRRGPALDEARYFLDLLGIGDLAGRLPHQLSRGQKQRVAIARALAGGAEVILADEPTGSLDPRTADDVLDALLTVSRRLRRPVVLVTHDHRLARRCDRVLRCRDGRVVELGRPAPERPEGPERNDPCTPTTPASAACACRNGSATPSPTCGSGSA